MPNYEKLQQKLVELDLSEIPKSIHNEVKKAVGGYLVNQILSTVAEGHSPVDGSAFPKLSAKYAKDEKGGDTTPNLLLTGDMLDSLNFKPVKEGISVGIMSASQRPKADGHNNFSGKSKLPERRFIPGEDQDFYSEIQDGIGSIIDEFKPKTLADIVDQNSTVNELFRKLNGED